MYGRVYTAWLSYRVRVTALLALCVRLDGYRERHCAAAANYPYGPPLQQFQTIGRKTAPSFTAVQLSQRQVSFLGRDMTKRPTRHRTKQHADCEFPFVLYWHSSHMRDITQRVVPWQAGPRA